MGELTYHDDDSATIELTADDVEALRNGDRVEVVVEQYDRERTDKLELVWKTEIVADSTGDTDG